MFGFGRTKPLEKKLSSLEWKIAELEAINKNALRTVTELSDELLRLREQSVTIPQPEPKPQQFGVRVSGQGQILYSVECKCENCLLIKEIYELRSEIELRKKIERGE